MSKQAKRNLTGTFIIAVAVLLSIASGRGLFGKSRAVDVVTIDVVASDMAFNVTNPTLVVRPGQMVRVVFRNEDPGMIHDFSIPELGVKTRELVAGEQAVLKFRVPDDGVFTYLCSFHPVSMRGVLQVGDLPD